MEKLTTLVGVRAGRHGMSAALLSRDLSDCRTTLGTTVLLLRRTWMLAKPAAQTQPPLCSPAQVQDVKGSHGRSVPAVTLCLTSVNVPSQLKPRTDNNGKLSFICFGLKS